MVTRLVWVTQVVFTRSVRVGGLIWNAMKSRIQCVLTQ